MPAEYRKVGVVIALKSGLSQATGDGLAVASSLFMGVTASTRLGPGGRLAATTQEPGAGRRPAADGSPRMRVILCALAEGSITDGMGVTMGEPVLRLHQEEVGYGQAWRMRNLPILVVRSVYGLLFAIAIGLVTAFFILLFNFVNEVVSAGQVRAFFQGAMEFITGAATTGFISVLLSTRRKG